MAQLDTMKILTSRIGFTLLGASAIFIGTVRLDAGPVFRQNSQDSQDETRPATRDRTPQKPDEYQEITLKEGT